MKQYLFSEGSCEFVDRSVLTDLECQSDPDTPLRMQFEKLHCLTLCAALTQFEFNAESVAYSSPGLRLATLGRRAPFTEDANPERVAPRYPKTVATPPELRQDKRPS